MKEQELKDLADRMAMTILKGLGTRSRWALRTGLDAAETDGISGVCVLQFPPKGNDHIDIAFTAGAVDVITRWGSPS